MSDGSAMSAERAQLETELRDALELQTATSEVLRLISDNPGDLTTVLDGLLDQAVRLSGADAASVSRIHGGYGTYLAGTLEGSTPFIGARWPHSESIGFGEAGGRNEVASVQDARHVKWPDALHGMPSVGSLLSVPLFIKEQHFGQLTLSRYDVNPFDEHEVRVLRAFADQAAVAIANAQLFTDLDESLELQIATSEILQVISANPGDIDTVFASIMQRAIAVCDADASAVWRNDGDQLTNLAQSDPAWNDLVGRKFVWPGPVPTELVFIDDFKDVSDDWADGRLPGSAIMVPLIVDDAVYGLLSATRYTVRPFEAPHATALSAFAKLAAIAIGNAKLFNDLDEALALQIATSEVLRLISANPGNVRADFDGIIERAAALCGATGAAIVQYDNGIGTYLASLMDPGLVGQSFPAPVPYEDLPQRYVTDFRKVRRPDQSMIPDIRSTLTVDLRRGDDLHGLLTLTRSVVQPFEQREGAIAQAFADQAAIAIENARLFRELQTRTDELRELNSNLARRVDDGVHEVERLNMHRRFVSPQLAEAIASDGEGAGEPSTRDHRALLRPALLHVLRRTGRARGGDGRPARVSPCSRADDLRTQRHDRAVHRRRDAGVLQRSGAAR